MPQLHEPRRRRGETNNSSTRSDESGAAVMYRHEKLLDSKTMAAAKSTDVSFAKEVTRRVQPEFNMMKPR